MFRIIRFNDAREFERLRAYYLVKYRMIKPKISKRRVVSTLKEIAGGGLSLRTKEPLPVSGTIELQIHFRPTGKIVTALARIVMVREIKANLSYEAGVSFLPSNYSDLYFNIGLVYKSQGRLAQAKVAFKKALEIDSDFKHARLELEKLKKKRGVRIKK